MFDEQHFSRDAANVRFDDDAAGVTVDGDETEFNWDEVETVTVENPPHAEAFDSKEFYKIPATVAKPIPQQYRYADDSVTLKKPREELKQAAWSLDNAPWTLGHPETGMVKDVDDVHGFWSDPRYIDSLDDLDADLHVPVADDEAKEYLEENADVSVGFYNRVARTDEYDGVVGGSDDDEAIDGYQTDMLFDHCASVPVGRCSGEDGCGLDAAPHGHLTAVGDSDPFKRGTRTTDTPDDAEGTSNAASDMDETTDAGGEMIDGTWYAVPPEDTSGDEPKYPIDNCSDAADAWRLRSHAEGLKIEQSTLEQRIKDRAETLDCDLPMDESEDGTVDAAAIQEHYDICPRCSDDGSEDDCGCDDTDTNTDTMEISFDDLSTDAALARLENEHEGASERLDELRQATDAAEAAQEAADEMDLDDVEELADAVAMKQERIDELEEKLDDARRPQMEEDAEFIAERTDRFGEDADDVMDNLDEDPDAVAEKRELVEDLTEGYDEQTANSGSDGSSGSTDSGSADRSGKYAKTPWE